MIQRIAGGESFNDKPTRFVELGRDPGVAAAETAQEDAREPLTEFICQERCRIQHVRYLRPGCSRLWRVPAIKVCNDACRHSSCPKGHSFTSTTCGTSLRCLRRYPPLRQPRSVPCRKN